MHISHESGNKKSTSLRRPDIVMIFPAQNDQKNQCCVPLPAKVYEIKPDSPNGRHAGPRQLNEYIRLLKQGGINASSGHGDNGLTGSIYSGQNCGMLDWSSTSPGLIFYRWSKKKKNNPQNDRPDSPYIPVYFTSAAKDTSVGARASSALRGAASLSRAALFLFMAPMLLMEDYLPPSYEPKQG